MLNTNMYVGGADEFPMGTFGGASGHFYLCHSFFFFFFYK